LLHHNLRNMGELHVRILLSQANQDA
jgi:hypothetical protein